MGKRRFAGTLSSPEHRTVTNKYAKLLHGHIRGWDIGLKIIAYVDSEDRDCFEIWTTGGSHDPSGKTLIGTLVEGAGWSEND